MWHQWFSRNFYEATRILFVRNENKNNFIQRFLLFCVSHESNTMHARRRSHCSDAEPRCTAPCLQAEEDACCKHVLRFQQRWRAIFCPAFLIWTRIYTQWTKRDGRSMSAAPPHISHFILMNTHQDMEEKKLLNTFVIFVFFGLKKYSCSFIKLQLSHWCHMTVLTMSLLPFWALNVPSCVAVYRGSESSRIWSKNIVICVLKMNEGLMGLEQHEGE